MERISGIATHFIFRCDTRFFVAIHDQQDTQYDYVLRRWTPKLQMFITSVQRHFVLLTKA